MTDIEAEAARQERLAMLRRRNRRAAESRRRLALVRAAEAAPPAGVPAAPPPQADSDGGGAPSRGETLAVVAFAGVAFAAACGLGIGLSGWALGPSLARALERLP